MKCYAVLFYRAQPDLHINNTCQGWFSSTLWQLKGEFTLAWSLEHQQVFFISWHKYCSLYRICYRKENSFDWIAEFTYSLEQYMVHYRLMIYLLFFESLNSDGMLFYYSCSRPIPFEVSDTYCSLFNITCSHFHKNWIGIAIFSQINGTKFSHCLPTPQF